MPEPSVSVTSIIPFLFIVTYLVTSSALTGSLFKSCCLNTCTLRFACLHIHADSVRRIKRCKLDFSGAVRPFFWISYHNCKGCRYAGPSCEVRVAVVVPAALPVIIPFASISATDVSSIAYERPLLVAFSGSTVTAICFSCPTSRDISGTEISVTSTSGPSRLKRFVKPDQRTFHMEVNLFVLCKGGTDDAPECPAVLLL